MSMAMADKPGGSSPPASDLITETGDDIITEGGDQIIAET